MRQPQLYDFVYLNKYGKSLFQVTGINHNPTDKYPTFEVWNVATLKDAEILCPIPCKMEEIYGVPFGDLEFHFPEGEGWSFFTDEDGEVSDDYVVNADDYSFWIHSGKWILDLSSTDPEPEIEYLHELQQYHRGVYGNDMNVFGSFVAGNEAT